MNFKIIDINQHEKWDDYVYGHPDSTPYNLYGWRHVIERTYGKKTYYLASLNGNGDNICGVLPLIHIKHIIFGNRLISIPYLDCGGILTDNESITGVLLQKAVCLGKKLNVSDVELRQQKPVTNFALENSPKENPFLCCTNKKNQPNNITCETNSHKVRMVLELPDSSKDLFQSFKSKLRSQIRRPIKSGLKAEIGQLELLDDFYRAFCINMRDLGSPVHSKKFLQNVLEEFSSSARIIIVYNDSLPLAGSIVLGFKEILFNPWASSLKQYSKLAPNMLLYWSMLEYACDNGYKKFDFGRSTPNEGTYRFKQQWGAEPKPIYWQSLYPSCQTNGKTKIDKDNFSKAIYIWRKLPVSLTKILGPMVRKNISL